jgi:hypothetical protein
MGFHEVAEHQLQADGVPPVATFLGFPDIVQDDALDAGFSTRVVQQVVAHLDRDHFRHVLMLGDGEDFGFCQFTERYAVFDCEHNFGLLRDVRPLDGARAPSGLLYVIAPLMGGAVVALAMGAQSRFAITERLKAPRSQLPSS